MISQASPLTLDQLSFRITSCQCADAGQALRQQGNDVTVQAEMPLGLDCARPEEAFVQWLTAKHVKHECCAIGRFEQTGRGAMAARDIRRGEVVIEVRLAR